MKTPTAKEQEAFVGGKQKEQAVLRESTFHRLPKNGPFVQIE